MIAGSRIGIGAAVVAMLTLTGCAAGQHAQTADEVPVVDGVSADAGPIALRAVTVAPPSEGSFPAGGDADLQLVMVNDGPRDDQLVEVTTDQAARTAFFRSGGAAETSGGSSGPAPTDTGTPAPSTVESINVPPGIAVSVGFSADQPSIRLQGLKEQLFPAQSFPITFRFAKAGSVSFDVAVHLTNGPSTTPTVEFSPTAEN